MEQKAITSHQTFNLCETDAWNTEGSYCSDHYLCFLRSVCPSRLASVVVVRTCNKCMFVFCGMRKPLQVIQKWSSTACLEVFIFKSHVLDEQFRTR